MIIDRMHPSLRCLDLSDVATRMYDKYDVTRSDAELAVDYLRCFLDAKRKRRSDFIILPQLADWAWHELILDTARYRTVCADVLGTTLHHVATDAPLDDPRDSEDVSENLRGTFLRSMAMMRQNYGLGLGDDRERWLGSGWDSPAYRLRAPIIAQRSEVNEAHSARRLNVPLVAKPIGFLSWLPARVARRFALTNETARMAVREYEQFIDSKGQSRSSELLPHRTLLCEIAWEEHVLWTDRYARDCKKLFGFFLEHTPRPLAAVPARPLIAA